MCCLTLFFERSELMSTWPRKGIDERPVRIPSRVQRGEPTNLIRVPHRSMSERLFIGTELIQIHMPHQKLTLARETAHKSCNSEASWTAYRQLQVGDLSFPDSLAGLSFFRSGWLIWAMSKQLLLSENVWQQFSLLAMHGEGRTWWVWSVSGTSWNFLIFYFPRAMNFPPGWNVLHFFKHSVP